MCKVIEFPKPDVAIYEEEENYRLECLAAYAMKYRGMSRERADQIREDWKNNLSTWGDVLDDFGYEGDD